MQPQYSLHERGRIHAFFFEGIDKLHLPWAVEALPSLLHLSLFLFFASLLVFLFNINHTVFSTAVWWVGLCTATYISITFVPFFWFNSPYHSPLSSPTWLLATGVLTLLFQFLSWLAGFTSFGSIRKEHFDKQKKHYLMWFVNGLKKTAEGFALKLTSEIDWCALSWILNCSDEDKELELFFASIPDSSCLKAVNNVANTSSIQLIEKMTEALLGFVHHTLTSNLVAQEVKRRRLDICRKAMITAPFRISLEIFHRFIHAEWEGLLSAVQFGLLLRGVDPNDPVTTYHSQVMLSIILSRVKEQDCDKDWFELATNHLGISRHDLNHYLTCGDSLLLANCIAFLWNIISDFFWIPSRRDVATLQETLRLVSKFDIEGTLPSLQHDFCCRWNDIIDIAGIVRYNCD